MFTNSRVMANMGDISTTLPLQISHISSVCVFLQCTPSFVLSMRNLLLNYIFHLIMTSLRQEQKYKNTMNYCQLVQTVRVNILPKRWVEWEVLIKRPWKRKQATLISELQYMHAPICCSYLCWFGLISVQFCLFGYDWFDFVWFDLVSFGFVWLFLIWLMPIFIFLATLLSVLVWLKEEVLNGHKYK